MGGLLYLDWLLTATILCLAVVASIFQQKQWAG